MGAVYSYTFSNVTATHTISATYVALTPYTVTASAGTGGTISPSGAVTVYSGQNQTFTITPNTGYTIASVKVDNVSQGATNSYTLTNVTANHAVTATFTNLNRNIPKTDQLLFGAITESLPASGSTGNWATIWPAGSSLTTMASPMVQIVNGQKWEQNLYSDGDGLRFGSTYSSAIPVNGTTIVAAVKPTRNGIGTSWTSVVDLFYNRLVIGVRNDSGQICVALNGSWQTGTTAISDGQTTVLSYVVQPNGYYKVYANGTQVMTSTTANAMTSLDPLWNGGATGFWSHMDVGRNDPDGWTTFNGNIGDFFVYKTALSDADRQLLETDVYNKFANLMITATSGSGGSISPSGSVYVAPGASQTFTITPDTNYAVSSVVVDGVDQGAISSYTFTNVTANHTISVTFQPTDAHYHRVRGSKRLDQPSGTVTRQLRR